MCCFSRSVESVSDTRIFARLTRRGTQFLAYAMQYSAKEPVAMILPLPVKQPASETSVRFISLEDYRWFFDDLGRAFPSPFSMGIGCGSSVEVSSKAASLLVQDVGDYVASFVPTVDDFDRLDAQFVIPKSTWAQLPQYHDFGFAVFQLKAASARVHPMALEFDSRWSDRIFFPTVHIHDGEVHSSESFDHSLYLQHAGLDSRVGRYESPWQVDSVTGFVRSKNAAEVKCRVAQSQGLLVSDLLLHRIDLQGTAPNEDQIFAVEGDAELRGFNWRIPWEAAKRASPWILGLGTIAWFLRRRNRIRASRQNFR